MTSPRLPAGYRLREYEIVRTLGQGSFGITYLAYDHRLDGPVAMKEYFPAECAVRGKRCDVVPAGREHREQFAWGLRRFLDEARTVHRFSHPNVVRAHRYFESQGTAYIVMEYAEGKSLGQILAQRRPLRPEEWRSLLLGLLAGLEHIHRNDYLHRDIKPANIIVRDADTQPVLVDFGSARIATGERTRTVVLTEGYAPIEQHSARARQGPYTDIYALAAVSFQALTGTPPLPAPDRLLSVDDVSWGCVDDLVGFEPWVSAIEHGLERRPMDRPQSVAEWWRELEEAWGKSNARRDEPATLLDGRTVLVDNPSASKTCETASDSGTQYSTTAGVGLHGVDSAAVSQPMRVAVRHRRHSVRVENRKHSWMSSLVVVSCVVVLLGLADLMRPTPMAWLQRGPSSMGRLQEHLSDRLGGRIPNIGRDVMVTERPPSANSVSSQKSAYVSRAKSLPERVRRRLLVDEVSGDSKAAWFDLTLEEAIMTPVKDNIIEDMRWKERFAEHDTALGEGLKSTLLMAADAFGGSDRDYAVARMLQDLAGKGVTISGHEVRGVEDAVEWMAYRIGYCAPYIGVIGGVFVVVARISRSRARSGC